MRIYKPGTVIAFHGHFKHEGQPADPKAVRFIVSRPSDDPAGQRHRVLVHRRDDELIRLGPGHYRVKIRAEEPGTWSYSWVYSPRHAARWTTFKVEELDE